MLAPSRNAAALASAILLGLQETAQQVVGSPSSVRCQGVAPGEDFINMCTRTFASALSGIVLLSALSFAQRRNADPKCLAVDRLVILPVVDRRTDKKIWVDLERIRRVTANYLTRKHYASFESDYTGDIEAITEAELKASKSRPGWIKRLGPAEARWVMVVGLDKIELQGGVNARQIFHTDVFGYLYDKDSASLFWDGEIVSAIEDTYSILAAKDRRTNAAIEQAIRDLLFDFPSKPLTKRK